jgi:hypothetical protein
MVATAVYVQEEMLVRDGGRPSWWRNHLPERARKVVAKGASGVPGTGLFAETDCAVHPNPVIAEQIEVDGYRGPLGSSAANTTWYLRSSRTDFANRGSCISFLMPAIVALAGTFGSLFFFLIHSY